MTHIESIHSKIHTWETLKKQVETWHLAGKNVVFSNGCFDIIHKGHIDYLNRAADLGDVLIMGLNTDESVGKLKGTHRPIQDEQSRLLIIAALQCVSAVVLFNEETPYELIKLIQPNVLVKGSDYEPANIVGFDIVTANGGDVKTINFLPGYSTSAIEKRIKAC